MALRFLVLASFVILSESQLHIMPHQLARMPTLQPMHIAAFPSSQLFMTHSANTILNQDMSIPISPGFLTASPVLLGETTQNILNQEAKVIGYTNSGSPGFLFSQHQSPLASHSTLYPQSIAIPLLSNAQQRPINAFPPTRVVPTIRSQVKESRTRPAQAPHYQASQNSEERPHRIPEPRLVYYDIPPNHPIPPPTNAPRHNFNEIDGMRPPPPPDKVPKQNVNEVDYMRPPPIPPINEKSKFSQFPSQNIVSASRDIPPYLTPPEPYYYNRAGGDQRPSPSRHFPRDSHSSPSSVRKLLKKFPRSSEGKSSSPPSDSMTESSDSFFQQVPRPLVHPFSFNRATSHHQPRESEAAWTQRGSTVHKHIFVHAAPEDYDRAPAARVVRPKVNPEQHVQLLFIKSPAPPPQPETVIELPQSYPPKTVVYILVKKPEEGDHKVKIVKPQPSKPIPPEIFFIRYGDRRANQGYPVPDLQSLYDNYGSSSQPAGEAQDAGLRSKRNEDELYTYAPLNAYTRTGQINEITQEEAEFHRANLNEFF